MTLYDPDGAVILTVEFAVLTGLIGTDDPLSVTTIPQPEISFTVYFSSNGIDWDEGPTIPGFPGTAFVGSEKVIVAAIDPVAGMSSVWVGAATGE